MSSAIFKAALVRFDHGFTYLGPVMIPDDGPGAMAIAGATVYVLRRRVLVLGTHVDPIMIQVCNKAADTFITFREYYPNHDTAFTAFKRIIDNDVHKHKQAHQADHPSTSH